MKSVVASRSNRDHGYRDGAVRSEIGVKVSHFVAQPPGAQTVPRELQVGDRVFLAELWNCECLWSRCTREAFGSSCGVSGREKWVGRCAEKTPGYISVTWFEPRQGVLRFAVLCEVITAQLLVSEHFCSPIGLKVTLKAAARPSMLITNPPSRQGL